VTAVRDTLARIATRPATEWAQRLEEEFPDDRELRLQAMLWLLADRESPEIEGEVPSLGKAADERYELSVRLDTGATASVWRAFDRRLGRNVAIKVFHDQRESEALDQVIAEARAASDVISDHVVRVLDVHHGDSHPYIVMELVGEHDAEKGDIVLGTASSTCRPNSIDEVARWVMQVARGVHDAHLRNVFHRDLKPHNVLVTPITRRARIADFGLAVGSAGSHLTIPAITLLKRGPIGPVSVRGTPEYMAPEQARGLSLALDPRSAVDREILVGVDVWGLGAIAYDLLHGRPPWIAQKDLSAWEIASAGEPPPRLNRTTRGERIPGRFRRVIEKAMAIDPAARYATAAAVANDLQAFLDKRPTTLDRSRLLRGTLWSRRNPQLALTAPIAIALLLLAAGTHMTVTRLRGQRSVRIAKIEELKAEQARLGASVEQTRRELAKTVDKLSIEQQNLANLEKTLAEDRTVHAALMKDKEEALLNATAATRRIVQQLGETRSELTAIQQTRLNLEALLETARRDAERAAKDRDRVRKEREAARLERQRERDELIAERDAAELELKAVQTELARVTAARSSRADTH
jgi:serine/threonine protein kinase